MKILNGIEKLVIDANPILSAVIGGKARDIFLTYINIAFYTTEFNFKEVEKYIPILSSKRDIPIDCLYLALSMLPVSVCNEEFYGEKIKQAKELIGQRDADDVHLLALSLKLCAPIWSNDKDFEGLGIKVYSTLDILKH